MCIEEGTTASLLFHLLLDMCPGGNICLFVSSSFRYVPRRNICLCHLLFLCVQEGTSAGLLFYLLFDVYPGGNICQDCKSEYQERLIPGLTSLRDLDTPDKETTALTSFTSFKFGCFISRLSSRLSIYG
jgi:hypothetical protein